MSLGELDLGVSGFMVWLVSLEMEKQETTLGIERPMPPGCFKKERGSD
jgi:hypothetical protein